MSRFTMKTGKCRDQARINAERAYCIKGGFRIHKRLPDFAVVHHVDFDPTNNINSNLVICEDQRYHKLLHIRTEAFKSTGNPNFRRCVICQKFSDLKDLKICGKDRYNHSICAKLRRMGME